MKIEQVDELNKSLKVAIPLTEQTGKARVKNRDIWYGYGQPVAESGQYGIFSLQWLSFSKWVSPYKSAVGSKIEADSYTFKNTIKR